MVIHSLPIGAGANYTCVCGAEWFDPDHERASDDAGKVTCKACCRAVGEWGDVDRGDGYVLLTLEAV